MSKVVREERRVERDGSGRGPPKAPPCSVGVSSRRGLQSTRSMRAARQGALALRDHGNGLSSRSRTACGLIVRCSLRSLVPRRVDHDAVRRSRSRPRLNVLLNEFFEAFFVCFFPAWAARFEFLEIDWLDKEASWHRRKRRSGNSTRWPAAEGVAPIVIGRGPAMTKVM